MQLLIGTSGYSYADWVGPVYPPASRPADYLRLYAERFDFVELNFSYYRMPDAKTVEGIKARAPDSFRFAAKAHRSLTHDRGTDIVAAAESLRRGLRPIQESGQLVALLLQYPFSFHYADEQRRLLDLTCRALEELPLAVEFRNRDWMRESVFAEMRDRGITLVSMDLPPLDGLPASGLQTTTETAYVRFHGRNRAAWWTGDSTSRYDYSYSAAELDEWAGRMIAALKGLQTMIIAFNNHYRGQAVTNAIELRERLTARPV